MEISDKEYKELVYAQEALLALQAGGVDKWDGYYESLKDVRRDGDLREMQEKFIEDIMVLLSEDCAYDFPAGREAGIRVSFSEDQALKVNKALGQFLCDYDDLVEKYK